MFYRNGGNNFRKAISSITVEKLAKSEDPGGGGGGGIV
ncbi:unnamed protein product, partial [marine sediment metagenome]